MLAVGYQMYFLAYVWIISVFFFLDSQCLKRHEWFHVNTCSDLFFVVLLL